MSLISGRLSSVNYAIRDVELLMYKYKIKYHLNIGDPIKLGAKICPDIKNKLIDTIYENWPDLNTYSNSTGLDLAKNAIREFYGRKGLKINTNDLFITSGVSEAINFLFIALFNSGDKILLPKPVYPLYDSLADLYGLKKIYYKYGSEEIDLNEFNRIVESEKPKVAILINPNNPLGYNLSKNKLQEMLDILYSNDVVVMSDEIYSELVFKGKMYEALRFSKGENLITLNGISKSHLLTGWRLGWITVNNSELFDHSHLNAAIRKVVELRLSSVTPLQYALPKILNSCKKHIENYKRHLKSNAYLVSEFVEKNNRLDLILPVNASHYVFIKHNLNLPDISVVERLAKSGVLVVPGSGFSMPGYFRVVTAGRKIDLMKAMKIINKIIN